MPCLHPITIKNRRYEKLGKLGTQLYLSKYAYNDPRLIKFEKSYTYFVGDDFLTSELKTGYHRKFIIPDEYIKVPCGKCAECIKNKRSQWAIRLLIETRNYQHNTFITLTIAPKYYKDIYKDPKKYLKLYIDRLRKSIGFRPKYFIIPEIGQDQEYTHRLHFHGIIFGTDVEKIPYSVLRDTWHYGIADTGYCNDKTCNYVVKYILKDYNKDMGINFKPFVFCSNGIGKSYLLKNDLVNWHVNSFDFRDYIEFEGRKYAMPVYYRDKIYDDATKFVKMLNRVFDEAPFEKVFNGTKYHDKRIYNKAVAEFYNWTLIHQLSQPLKPITDVIGSLSNMSLLDVNNAFFYKAEFYNQLKLI